MADGVCVSRFASGDSDLITYFAFIPPSPPSHPTATAATAASVVSGSYDRTVRVTDIATGTTTEERVLKGHTGVIWHVVTSPNGEQLFTASDDNSIRVHRRSSDGHMSSTPAKG